MKAIKMMIIIVSLLLVVSNTQAQYQKLDCKYTLTSVKNDTIIKLRSSSDMYCTGSMGYFSVDFTNTSSNDGKFCFGVIQNVYGTEEFFPMTDTVYMNKLNTNSITVNGQKTYLYNTIDGTTKWSICLYFTNFMGDYPALYYVKKSADTGYLKIKFNYKY